MTKQRTLFQFRNELPTLDNLVGINFIITLAENTDKVVSAIDKLEKIKEPSTRLQAFTKASSDLWRTYAEVDESGNKKTQVVGKGPSGPLSKYVLDKAREVEFREAQKTLREKYAKEILEAEERDLQFLEAVEQDIDFKKLNLTTIKASELPTNITQGQLRTLMLLNMVTFK